jgi:hypothetical protein
VLAGAASAGSAAYRVESSITIRLFGESTERTSLASSGTVPITSK